jgi:hypothetical protein
MSKPNLSVEQLQEAGFQEIGCWELNDARELAHKIDLPKRAGVYAFAIDGIVQYVGLASKSLHQRLNFYRKPGASQATNVRLNEIIRDKIASGATVQILIAHPSDTRWNGLTIKGPEGLEAGLIADFHLPWNVRGSPIKPAQTTAVSRGAKSPTTPPLAQQILGIVKQRPGITELQIAQAIYGPSAVQPQVNQDCRLLVQRRLLERRGRGGRADPYTYVVMETP